MIIEDVVGLINARTGQSASPWYIRSASPDSVSHDSAEKLRERGVSVVVDLREPSEVGEAHHGLPVVSVGIFGQKPPTAGSLEQVYEMLLRQRGAALTKAVAVIADAEGIALVHCAVGKDRTGLVIALARLVAGDDPDAIIADYVLSGPQIRQTRQAYAESAAKKHAASERDDLLRLHLESPAEAIVHALAVITELGGAEQYLLDNGLSQMQIERLRHKNAAADPDEVINA